jgi:ATP-dependent helicase/nuclease subunit B
MNPAVVVSASAAKRLDEARRFVDQFPAGNEILLIGASRGAVDDFARQIASGTGATFGLHRLSFTQLAARLAATELAARGQTPASSLGHQAIAARAAFDAAQAGALDYFAPVSDTPGFPKALAKTILELRLAGIGCSPLQILARSGPDLAALLSRVEQLMGEAGNSDRAVLFDVATSALTAGSPHAAADMLPFGAEPGPTTFPPMPTLLLDVPLESEAEAAFLFTLVERAPQALMTVPLGDARTLARLRSRGLSPGPAGAAGPPQAGNDMAAAADDDRDGDLARLRRFLFSTEVPPERDPSGELSWFSAPGESREAVEIARRLLKEAERGIRFDEIAILVRSPQQYIGVLEHALGRAGIPVYFDRGIRRPHPGGRAFLAMLSCAAENLSAKRFAEYLSLGQVPSQEAGRQSGRAAWVASSDEAFAASRPALPDAPDDQSDEHDETDIGSTGSVVAGTLRAPWKWEALLVESAVIGGSDRWTRRLDGLAAQYRLNIQSLKDDDPDSPKIPHLEREVENLEHLRSFALPIVEMISGWPETAIWGEWLHRLEALAPRVLRWPEQVLRVLADLRPMGSVGPVSLGEVRDVLADRLLSLEVDPPATRYGRVFVGSPHQARGRTFKVIFVPGLAERLFPQKVREDPLLLDELRDDIEGDLSRQDDRAELERLLLRLSVGAASERLYVSFPRIDTAEARARVPSFYALEIVRAVTGRVPDHQTLERMAAQESLASLAWPAPVHPADAIDDLEHDLSVLRRLMVSGGDVRGRARYMLSLNDCLRRSVTERWARAEKRWSQFDGLVRVTDASRAFLGSQRLSARPYSVSALQKYSICPYQFFLSAAYRLAPLEEPEPLQRMDPLTKGSLFHQVQAEFFRALQAEGLVIRSSDLARVFEVLEQTLTRIAADYYELLAPAIDRVWHDEIAAIRTDLRVWVDRLARGTDWEPFRFEFAFGLPGQPGHDPASLRDPVTIDGRFVLRGSVDLIERRRTESGGTVLRVTDHKTSRNRSQRNSIVGGGAQLQPVIYSLAVEQATGISVEEARFSYCTTAGGFTEHPVPITERTRRMGVEVLEIVDRAVELGMLPPAPAERACTWCDFLPVCGPDQARRASRKSQKDIADLLALRGMQ